MNYWLVKFAPFRYSWQDVLRNSRFEIYSVRNAQSRNNLQVMELQEKVLFYHSQYGNEVMGIMQVIQGAHQDPTTINTKWLSVTFEPISSFEKPVSLKKIKQNTSLQNVGLVRQQRLAVMKLEESDFLEIIRMSKEA